MPEQQVENPEEERRKLKQFIKDNPELYNHVRYSSRSRLMWEIMKREKQLKQSNS